MLYRFAGVITIKKLFGVSEVCFKNHKEGGRGGRERLFSSPKRVKYLNPIRYCEKFGRNTSLTTKCWGFFLVKAFILSEDKPFDEKQCQKHGQKNIKTHLKVHVHRYLLTKLSLEIQ